MAFDLAKIQDKVTKASGSFQTTLMKYGDEKKKLQKLIEASDKIAADLSKIKDANSEPFKLKERAAFDALKMVFAQFHANEAMKNKMYEMQKIMEEAISDLQANENDKKVGADVKRYLPSVMAGYFQLCTGLLTKL